MATFKFTYPDPIEFPGDGTFAGFSCNPGDKVDDKDHPGVDFTAPPFDRYFNAVTDKSKDTKEQ